MKKAILNLALCAAIVAPMVSCSSESFEEKQENAMKELVSTGMQPSESGISLMGSNVTGSDESRAPIYTNNNDKGKFFETKDYSLGIFMLAKNVCDQSISDGTFSEYIPYNKLAVDWTSPVSPVSQAYNDVWSVYLDNVRAKAEYIKEETTDPAHPDTIGTKLVFNPADVDVTDSHRFYPMGAYHNYWFYGYAPHNGATITKESSRVVATFSNLNGTQDVIYGRAKPDAADVNKTYAYSAKYFRFAENRDPITDEAKPVEVGFSHKMMMVRLKITAGGTPINTNIANTDRNYLNAYNTTVENISFTNVPAEMELVLANNLDNEEDGKFMPKSGTTRDRWYTLDVNKKPEPKYFGSYTADNRQQFLDEYATNVLGTENNVPDTITAGNLLLPVIKGLKEEPYMISLKLKYQNTSLSMLVPMRLPVGVDDYNDDYFKEGRIYDVVLKIFNPESINLNATLNPWIEATVSPFAGEGGTNIFPIH